MQEQSKNLGVGGQYLTFSLKGQMYGLAISSVQEINRMSEIAPVPQTPPFVAGVMNLRGKVIPVVDLRMKFGFEKAPYTKETCIIVIETDSGQVGTIVDSVSAVVDLPPSQIEAPPMMGDMSRNSYIVGMGKAENTVIILVDVVRALSREQVQLSTLAERAAA